MSGDNGSPDVREQKKNIKKGRRRRKFRKEREDHEFRFGGNKYDYNQNMNGDDL